MNVLRVFNMVLILVYLLHFKIILTHTFCYTCNSLIRKSGRLFKIAILIYLCQVALNLIDFSLKIGLARFEIIIKKNECKTFLSRYLLIEIWSLT